MKLITQETNVNDTNTVPPGPPGPSATHPLKLSPLCLLALNKQQALKYQKRKALKIVALLNDLE
jgi:hypothetical protein